jgi:hypothetical protein
MLKDVVQSDGWTLPNMGFNEEPRSWSRLLVLHEAQMTSRSSLYVGGHKDS